MVLRLISCSPWRPGFFVTIAAQTLLRGLTPATGRQDHTTWPYAIAPFVHAHEAHDGAAASTASRANVRDDHDTPLLGHGTVLDRQVICVGCQVYFGKSEKNDWAGFC
jgi:hypothetical protein